MFAEQRRQLGGLIIFLILCISSIICYFTSSHVSNLINDPKSPQEKIDNARTMAIITYVIIIIITLILVSTVFYFFCIKKYRYIPIDVFDFEQPQQSPLLNDGSRRIYF